MTRSKPSAVSPTASTVLADGATKQGTAVSSTRTSAESPTSRRTGSPGSTSTMASPRSADIPKFSPPPTPPRAAVDKGKRRADPGPGRPVCPPEADAALTSLLEEALHSPLDLPASPEKKGRGEISSNPSTPGKNVPRPKLAAPPRAHRPSVPVRPALRPRLVSQLTRATLPTSSLSYTYAEEHWGDHGWRQDYHLVESPGPSGSGSGGPPPSDSTQSHTYTLSRWTDEFPDLNPVTGLPERKSGDSHTYTETQTQTQSDPQRWRVQRTISQLSRSTSLPSSPQASTSNPFSIPGLPGLPALPNFNLPSFSGSRSSLDLASGFKRTFTSSSTAGKEPSAWTSWMPGHKGRVDALLDESDQAETVEEEEVKHAIKYASPKYPIVFCHGLLGFDYLGPESMPALQISHWRGIREVLEANGCEVMVARVPATSSIQDRAQILNDLIEERYAGRTVNLVAHSMGGLDCRYLISQLQPDKFQVASLTTISTPHRGSPFADYVIDNVIGRDRLPQLLGVLDAMKLPHSGDGSAFVALGTRAMAEFNAEVVDDPHVKYFSWGASYDPGLFDTFRWPHSVILAKEGPNDGMVSVYSAKWGEYRGTLLGVNHLDLVGWVNNLRYMMAGWTGKPISFKPATFYLEISDYLAEQGF